MYKYFSQKLSWFVALIFFTTCQGGTSTQKENENADSTTSETLTEKKASISEEEVKKLLNETLKAEDFIRGYNDGEQFTVKEQPYIMLVEGINTYALLKEYVSKFYSQKATEEYLTNLDVAINPATDEQIGRMAIYFYSKNYALDRTDVMKIIETKGDDKKRVYAIVLPFVTMDEAGIPTNEPSERLDTLKNFEIIFEQNTWKVNTIPDKFRENY